MGVDAAFRRTVPSQLPIKEHEVLRVAGILGGSVPSEAAASARKEVLKWIQKRSGGELPPEAWQFETFDHLAGGRNSSGVRIVSDDYDVWAVRADDPDKKVAGRIWTTEVVVGSHKHGAQFSARLLANTKEFSFNISPTVPGFVLQIISKIGLTCGKIDVEIEPWNISVESDVGNLIHNLVSPDRIFPIFAISLPENSSEPLINPQTLAKAVAGLATVAVIPPEYTSILKDRFQRSRSVSNGAIRAYMPGFNEHSRPFDHRLVFPDQLSTPYEVEKCQRWMQILAARESVLRHRLGQDVLAFAAIRNESLKYRQISLAKSGASVSQQLDAAAARIEALEQEITGKNEELDFFDQSHREAEERARNAESQYRGSVYRIDELIRQLKQLGGQPRVAELPDNWNDFANWCETELAGLVSLTPAAKRGTRNAEFEDVALAARCLVWLSTTYRQGRIDGASGDFVDAIVETGYKNSRCGSDEFEFDWQDRRLSADWHIKDNSGTRIPSRCLRIYYTWEPETQQVVIADMPHHRRSSFS